jgi:hypothetical protein
MVAAAFARFRAAVGLVSLQDKPLAEPEPAYGRERPMTGFFNALTPEQKARALAYTGEESHGDQSFPKRDCGQAA